MRSAAGVGVRPLRARLAGRRADGRRHQAGLDVPAVAADRPGEGHALPARVGAARARPAVVAQLCRGLALGAAPHRLRAARLLPRAGLAPAAALC